VRRFHIALFASKNPIDRLPYRKQVPKVGRSCGGNGFDGGPLDLGSRRIKEKDAAPLFPIRLRAQLGNEVIRVASTELYSLAEIRKVLPYST